MFIRPFREHHLLNLLEGYSLQTAPLDLFISRYFREHKAIGSKDRAFIAETAYALIRWQNLLDFFSSSSSWEGRYTTFSTLDWEKIAQRPDIPPHIRVSFPKELFDLFVASHGLQKANELCQISNTAAPITVRVNLKKISREKLLEKWAPLYQAIPTSLSNTGIVFPKRLALFDFPEFREGLFEVQDEGSQLLSDLVNVEPKQLVLDYCAGSGGKTLAFAPRMHNSGQIYLHDIRPYALQEAKKRLKRAGIQNAQVLLPDSPQISKLKKKMDWVLVDAPCSGTGTLRRNPDIKYRFTETMLQQLIGEQRSIFEKALSFMKPEGRIIYATCSLLKEENENQVQHFMKTYALTAEGQVFRSLPAMGEMDGFFAVVLKKT